MNLHIDKMQYQKKNILKGAVIFIGLIIFYSACEDSPILRQRLDCAPAPASMEIVPQALSTEDSANWTLGPYTQGTLHFTVRGSLFNVTLFNRQKDSVVLDLLKVFMYEDNSAYPFQLAIKWNTDAGLINILKNDELWLQRTLPFYDDLGVHSMKTALVKTTLDSLTNESLIQDPADIKIAYWGNGLDPDEQENSANRPWDAQLAEMTHSQGVFLRIQGNIIGLSDGNYSSPIRTLKPQLEKLLSERPDFMIISAGSVEESNGGGYLPTFRQEMTEALTLISAAGVQPIILTLPPVAENAPVKAKDLRGTYNMELRTLAVNHGASVVDLADRFNDPVNADQALIIEETTPFLLSQAGHDVLAQELSTLIQYYVQFGGRD